MNLARITEDFCMSLLKTDTRLKGKAIVRHDSDRIAESDCVVVQATLGPQMEAFLEVGQMYEVELSISYRGGAKSTPEENDLAASAIVDSVYSWGKTNAVAASEMARRLGFAYLRIEPGGGSAQPDTKNSRHRNRTFPVLAMTV
jgi:hypothetical protein